MQSNLGLTVGRPSFRLEERASCLLLLNDFKLTKDNEDMNTFSLVMARDKFSIKKNKHNKTQENKNRNPSSSCL